MLEFVGLLFDLSDEFENGVVVGLFHCSFGVKSFEDPSDLKYLGLHHEDPLVSGLAEQNGWQT